MLSVENIIIGEYPALYFCKMQQIVNKYNKHLYIQIWETHLRVGR